MIKLLRGSVVIRTLQRAERSRSSGDADHAGMFAGRPDRQYSDTENIHRSFRHLRISVYTTHYTHPHSRNIYLVQIAAPRSSS